MKQIRTRTEMENIIKEAKNVSEFALNNESHPFYTDFVEVGQREHKVMISRFTKAIAALNKNLPGGTWTFTIDGAKQ